jgi:hypothetical protein
MIEAEYQIASRRGEHCRHDHRQDLESISVREPRWVRRRMNFPVSIKGVLVVDPGVGRKGPEAA